MERFAVQGRDNLLDGQFEALNVRAEFAVAEGVRWRFGGALVDITFLSMTTATVAFLDRHTRAGRITQSIVEDKDYGAMWFK